jgi:hypothetical protein
VPFHCRFKDDPFKADDADDADADPEATDETR